MGSCQNLGSTEYGKNESMAEAFVNYGKASVYVGWHESNYSGQEVGFHLFDRLLKGDTMNDVFDYLRNYTYDNRKYFPDAGVLDYIKDEAKESGIDIRDYNDLTRDYETQTLKDHDGKIRPKATLYLIPDTAKNFRLVEPPAVVDPPQDITKGLVAYYPFNGSANDMSGNGNNGQLIGGVKLTADRKNQANSAYSFGGYNSTSAIKVPNSNSLRFTDEVTISLWYKLNGYDGMDGYGKYVTYGVHSLVAKDGDRGGLNLMVAYNTPGKNERYWGGSAQSVNWKWMQNGAYLHEALMGKWVHVSLVCSKSFDELFINGVSVAKGKTENRLFTQSNSKDLYLGRFGFSTGGGGSGWYPLNGCMDDVRIYNRALTDVEIRTLYEDSRLVDPPAVDENDPVAGTDWPDNILGSVDLPDFGNVKVNSLTYSWTTQNLELRNDNDIVLQWHITCPAGFSVDNSRTELSGSIQPHRKEIINVIFKPTAAIHYNETITIYTNAGKILVNVSGTGIP
jgi:hypothetical protein